MNRRDFLKAVAATSGLLVIPDIRFLLSDEALLVGEKFVAPIRELIDFDEVGLLVVWHDVIIGRDTGGREWDGYKQATITNVITGLDCLPDARIAAAKTLSQYMRENKIPVSYLHGLPMPTGYVNRFAEMTTATEKKDLRNAEIEYRIKNGKKLSSGQRRYMNFRELV